LDGGVDGWSYAVAVFTRILKVGGDQRAINTAIGRAAREAVTALSEP
jgi:hypothetical protein